MNERTNTKTTCRNRRRNAHGRKIAKAQFLRGNTTARGHLYAWRRTQGREILDGFAPCFASCKRRAYLESSYQTRYGALPCVGRFSIKIARQTQPTYRRSPCLALLCNDGWHNRRRTVHADFQIHFGTSRYGTRHH